jgi:hypothetical protein
MSNDFSWYIFLSEPSDCGANLFLPAAASIQQMDGQHPTLAPKQQSQKNICPQNRPSFF